MNEEIRKSELPLSSENDIELLGIDLNETTTTRTEATDFMNYPILDIDFFSKINIPLKQAVKVGNVWTNIISSVTGESVNYEVVTSYWDGSAMDDSKVDGVIYRKKDNQYLKLIDEKIKAIYFSVSEEADNTEKFINILRSGSKIEFPECNRPLLSNQLSVNKAKIITGDNTRIHVQLADNKLFSFSSQTERIRDILVQGFIVSQTQGTAGGGTNNDHFPIDLMGTVNAKIINNSIIDADLGVSTTFGAIQLNNEGRRGEFNLFAFNFFENIRKMAIQNIGCSYNRIVGNAINGLGGDSHGIRHSGYGADHTTAKNCHCHGCVSVGNIIQGMLTGISFQNTSKFNVVSGITTKDISACVIQATYPTIDDNNVECNIVESCTFEDVNSLIAIETGAYNKFDLVGSGVTGENAIIEYQTSKGTRLGNNHYTVLGTNFQNIGVLRYPHNTLDIDISDCMAGLTISQNASFAKGGIKVRRSQSYAVNSFANNCELTIHAHECAHEQNLITISGNNNLLTINTDGNVLIAGNNNTVTISSSANVQIGGTGNVLRGNIEGTINSTGSGVYTHDVTGVIGYSTRDWRIYTTDKDGRITIPHRCKTSNLSIVTTCNSHTATCRVMSQNSSRFMLELWNMDGSRLSNTEVTVSWKAEAIF